MAKPDDGTKSPGSAKSPEAGANLKIPDFKIPDFKIIERRRVHPGFFPIDQVRLIQRRHDGGWSRELEREVIVAREAVAVLLYDPRPDRVVLIDQLRLPASLAGFPAMQTEIVAGLMETGESPVEVARREVFEETGVALIGEPLLITRTLTSPGGSTETVNLFCGRVDSAAVPPLAGLASEDEDIRTLVIPLPDMLARIADGRIANAFTIIAGYWLAANRKQLRRRWA
ncbi:MAG TPA: NUDIX domain-containing protein [Stellaceae bacterium]|nr:NUDIX domain-containing protein [Stellaceae bacterium]